MPRHRTYISIAQILARDGNLEGSSEIFEQVTKMFARIKDKKMLAYSYCYLGEKQLEPGEIDSARQSAALALKAATRVKDDKKLPFIGQSKYDVFASIARLQVMSSDAAAAGETFELASKKIQGLVSDKDTYIAYSALAEIQAEAGNVIEARDSFALARGTAARLSDDTSD